MSTTIPKLPQQLSWEDADNKWAAIINPILAKPIVNGQLLTNISLINGTTIVNHKLGRILQGYIVVMSSAPATIYDNQISNQMPQLTLSLTSNNAANVSLWVF